MKNSTKIWLAITTLLCVTSATLVALIYNDNKKHPSNFEPTKYNLKKESCEINSIEEKDENKLIIFLSQPIDCYSVKYRGEKMILNTFTYTEEPKVTSIEVSTVKKEEVITEISLQEKRSKTAKRKIDSVEWQLI